MNHLHFEKATFTHKDMIFKWLEEPHMKEFWDNSQEHKDDILNFIHGRKQHYFYGTTKYWVGFLDNHPFCFVLTDELLADQDDLTALLRAWLSKTGKTISLDFGIGNKTFLGQGLAAPTLQAFVEFYNAHIDPQADTFFIDPNENNPRAKHVYEKAGFKIVDKYIPKKGYFIGDKSLLMVKKLSHKNYAMRLFTHEDIKQIIEILQTIGWEAQYVEGQKRSIEKLTSDEEGDVFVAEHGNQILGFIQAQHYRWNRLSYIHGLVISSDHRRQGIAATLLAHVEHVAHARGNRGVFVDTPIDNLEGREFYQAQGYAEAYKMPDFYEEGLDGVTYLKLFKKENKKSLPPAVIRPATTADVASMVALSDKKRSAYEQIHPQFWRRRENANETQSQWFKELLSQADHIFLIAEASHQILGFIIGELKRAPEVYDPGGLTLMIDDFCVESPELWNTVGDHLLRELQQKAKQRGAVQTLVVCGYHDEPKRQFLRSEGLNVVSEWYVRDIK